MNVTAEELVEHVESMRGRLFPAWARPQLVLVAQDPHARWILQMKRRGAERKMRQYIQELRDATEPSR